MTAAARAVPGSVGVGPRPAPTLLEPALLVLAAAAGLAAAWQPLAVLGLCCLAGVAALVWVRPATAAYLLVGVTPLVAGIDRGVVVPLLRPNEAVEVLVGGVLLARWMWQVRSGQLRVPRPGPVGVAVVLLALTSSVVPLATMVLRGRPVTADDVSYALVLWKLAGVYLVVRSVLRTERQVRTCLLVSVGAACAVAVVGVLQGLDLGGVRALLATYYAPFGDTSAITAVPRGGSTLSLPAATADLMVLNLAVVTVLWLHGRRRHRLALAGVVALLVLAVLAAGEFSSVIGLVAAAVTLSVVTGSYALLGVFGLLSAGGAAVVWPVIAERLQGFSTASGMPASWEGRLHNLRTYFWPELSSAGNVLLGVRPGARVPVASQATGWVWIESGYTWLLWGGGLPLLGSFVLLAWVVGARGWRVARSRPDAWGAAAAAAVVGVVVMALLMVFDPHLTYRGSGDEFFVLAALTAGGSALQRGPHRTRG